MTSVLAGLAAVVLAALLAVAAHAGTTLLAAAVALAVVLVALGWAVLLHLPHARGTSVVVAVSGWAATGAALVTSTRTQPLGVFAVLLAGCVLVAFLHELARRDARHSLVESVTGTVSGQVVAVLGAGWVFVPSTRLGVDGVVIAASAAAVTALVTGIPTVPDAVRGWVALGAGTGAAGVAAVVTSPSSLVGSLALGLSVSASVAGLALLLSGQETARTPLGVLAASAAPVCAVGTVAFAVARLATG